MGRVRPLQDAKAGLSELIGAAGAGPKTITRHGEEVAVLISPEAYRRLTRTHSGKAKRLTDSLRSCPAVPEFELPARHFEAMRKVDFD